MTKTVDSIGMIHETDGTLAMSCIGGSHLYNLSIESSDTDYRGVYFSRIEDILDVTGSKFEEHSDERNDVKYYPMNKFLHLASGCNPNIIELLAVPDSKMLYCSSEFDELRRNIGWFVSQRAFHTFSGYAFAQIKKATGVNKKAMSVDRFVNEDGLRFAWSVVNSSDEIRRRTFKHLFSIKKDFSADDIERMTCGDFVKYLGKISFDEKDLSSTGYCEFLKMARKSRRDFMYRYDVFGENCIKRRPLMYAEGNKGGIIDDSCMAAIPIEGIPGLYSLVERFDSPRLFNDDGSIIESKPEDNGEDAEIETLIMADEQAYEKHVAEYHSFWEWMANRNEARYTADWQDDGKYDAKNMMHTMRLIISAEHISEHGVPLVEMDGQNRDFLMSIRRGEVPYSDIIGEAESRIARLRDKFEKSGLPHGP